MKIQERLKTLEKKKIELKREEEKIVEDMENILQSEFNLPFYCCDTENGLIYFECIIPETLITIKFNTFTLNHVSSIDNDLEEKIKNTFKKGGFFI